MLLHAIFPLMGISLLWIQLPVDRFTVKGIALALPAFVFTPTKAHVIPPRSLTAPEDLSRLGSIASVHTEFR